MTTMKALRGQLQHPSAHLTFRRPWGLAAHPQGRTGRCFAAEDHARGSQQDDTARWPTGRAPDGWQRAGSAMAAIALAWATQSSGAANAALVNLSAQQPIYDGANLLTEGKEAALTDKVEAMPAALAPVRCRAPNIWQ